MDEYYYIVTKMEFVDGIVTYTNIGYVLLESDANIINNNYLSYKNWVETNITNLDDGIIQLSDFFIINPIVYDSLCKTNCIDGFNLLLITDIYNL